MATKTRHRSRSSVDHIFELVEHLEEDQLQNLLHELNSTGDNVQVSKGVEFFDERLRRSGSRKDNNQYHPLRPTPSFLNQPHEPADWPRQKPRPVSGSQWRQSMRIVSSPYAGADKTGSRGGALARHQTEPISPPLTASPPSSPPLSPPHSAVGLGDGILGSPRRSVTAPMLRTSNAGATSYEIRMPGGRSPDSPVSPPRNSEEERKHGADADAHSRPSLSEFGSFSFGLSKPAEASTATRGQQDKTEDKEVERPVSPRAAAATQDDTNAVPTSRTPSPPPAPALQHPDFNRISTMPLPTLHTHHEDSLDIFSPPHVTIAAQRPSTSTGLDASRTDGFKPRSFRRISRPVFLSPVSTASPDDLASKLLSAYLSDDLRPSASGVGSSAFSRRHAPAPSASTTPMEEMLREPLTPRSKLVFGRAEREIPGVSGIFEVLTEG